MRTVPTAGFLLLVAIATTTVRGEDVAWSERMGGANPDYGYGITVDGSGNAYVTGVFRGTATFGSYTLTSAGSNDAFVEKLDSSGMVLWARHMGGAFDDYGAGIAVDASGNVYVTGVFSSTATFGSFTLASTGFDDIFVERLDTNGNVQWAKRMGGAFVDYGIGIAVDTSGNMYVTGGFYDRADFGSYTFTSAGPGDIFVEKLDNSGTVQWAMHMGGTDMAVGQGIALDASGNMYVTGLFYGTIDFGTYTLTASASSSDVFVEKLDNSGTVQWARRMGGTDADEGLGITADPSGNSYVTGNFHGSADFGSYTLTSVGPDDVFAEKLNSDGEVVWARRMGGTFEDVGHAIARDATGNLHVTGTFEETASFDSYSLTSAGSTDIFVVTLDSNGNVKSASGGGGMYNDYGGGIATDPSGNAYVTGSFYGTADFAPYTLTSEGDQDTFVAKLSQCVPDDTPCDDGNACTTNDTCIGGACVGTPPFPGCGPLRIIGPNGGETLLAGSTVSIQWDAPSTAVKFDLQYSINNGKRWKRIATAATTGSPFVWTVPAQANNKPTSDVRITAYDTSNAKVGTDPSDATFSIEEVRLTAPNGGESLTSGTIATISWVTAPATLRPVARVKLLYTITGGPPWKRIGTLTGNPGTYAWTVPNARSSSCKILVALQDSSGRRLGKDESYTVFTVHP